MSVIAPVYQRPRCMNDDTAAGDHDSASTRTCRPRQQTTSNGNGPARSHPTSSSRFKNGKQMHGAFQNRERDIGRALEATSPGDTQRYGTLWTIKQWKRLAHYMTYVRCAAFFDTLSREFLMLTPMGRSEDIRLALRRRVQREMKKKKSNVANLPEAQWAAKPYREATGEPRGRRRRTTAIIHRLRCTTNDARFVGIGGSAFPLPWWHGIQRRR